MLTWQESDDDPPFPSNNTRNALDLEDRELTFVGTITFQCGEGCNLCGSAWCGSFGHLPGHVRML